MIYRAIYSKLKDHLPKKEFSIITGARQTGKSTILRQLEEHCRENNIPSVFLNLENKPILEELDESPLNLIKFLPVTEKRVIAFVDEVQYLKDASNFLKLLYDEHVDQVKIVATGSSAFYIDKNFRDSLAGRKKLFLLPTCSFSEYLELRTRHDLVEEVKRLLTKPGLKSASLPYLKMEWEAFMIYGGYPAVISEPDEPEKIERLKELRDSFVKRDIEESGVVNQEAFYKLMKILAGQTGSLVNVNELATTLRIKHETVGNYLWIMQKCHHLVLINPFFKNLRKELVKMPKAYFMDTGLRNCLKGNFQPLNQRSDKGELWENMVFKMLNDKHGREELFYWRTSAGNEVDFVLPNTNTPTAIEVKYDLTQARQNKYRIFTEAYPHIPLIFLWLQPFNEAFFQSYMFLD